MIFDKGLLLVKTGSTERIRDAERTIRLLKQATKAQLIDRGFAGLSIQAILEEAGVSKGALFHHYPTKDHLVAAAFEDVLIELAAKLHEAGRQLRAGRLTKRTFLQVATETVESDLFIGCMEIALANRAEYALSEHVADAIGTWREALFRFWDETFELPDSTPEEVRVHWALASNALRGHAFSFSFGGTQEARARHYDGFLRIFLNEALVRPPDPQGNTLTDIASGRR